MENGGEDKSNLFPLDYEANELDRTYKDSLRRSNKTTRPLSKLSTFPMLLLVFPVFITIHMKACVLLKSKGIWYL